MKSMNSGLACIAMGILLSACGGGSDTSATPPPAGGVAKAGVASGPIATFGSIVVNGVRYNTDNAQFQVNDMPGSQSDLRVGQIVNIKGTIDANGTTGTASDVRFDDAVKGLVQDIDLAGQRLVVLGQNVFVRAETSFDDRFSPASLEGVSLNQIVEVSGQYDADGNVVATRIEWKPAGTQFEVHGTVGNHDASNRRFNINALVVDYSSALLDDFPAGQIDDGDFVEAKGASLGVNDELLASKVELEEFLPGAATGDHVEIEGFVTRFSSAQDFDVAGQPVTTNSSTRFEDGSAADLGLNVKVEAEGDLDSNGVLVADKIEIHRAKAVRIEANVDSVNTSASSLAVLGITVNIDNRTRMEDKSDTKVSPLSLSDINAGDYVEIRGNESAAGSGVLLAARFEREDPEGEATLQGFVESISEPSLVIMGVTIETNAATRFEGANDNTMSAAEFFGQLTTNTLVKAKGSEVANSTLVATEVELEFD